MLSALSLAIVLPYVTLLTAGEYGFRQAYHGGSPTAERLAWLDWSLTLWPFDQERRRIYADAHWHVDTPQGAVTAIDWALSHDPWAVDLLRLGIGAHERIGDRDLVVRAWPRLRRLQMRGEGR